MTNVSDDRCHMTHTHMALWVSMERYEPQESGKELKIVENVILIENLQKQNFI